MITASVIGNLGADAEVVSSNGNKFVTLSIAHTRKFTQPDGKQTEQTDWVDAIINNVEHPVIPYLKRGVKVFVYGSARMRVYSSKKDRMMKAGLTINVQSIELCGGQSELVPRSLIDPDTAAVYNTQKYYWTDAPTKGMRSADTKVLVDERGGEYVMDFHGFVAPKQQAPAENSEATGEQESNQQEA